MQLSKQSKCNIFDKDQKVHNLQELNMRVKKNSITGIMGKSAEQGKAH